MLSKIFKPLGRIWDDFLEGIEHSEMLVAADEGNPAAQYHAGMRSLQGTHGHNKSEDEALYWLRLAADNGEARAVTVLKDLAEAPVLEAGAVITDENVP